MLKKLKLTRVNDVVSGPGQFSQQILVKHVVIFFRTSLFHSTGRCFTPVEAVLFPCCPPMPLSGALILP